MLTKLFTKSELLAKIKTVAPWYQDDCTRDRGRLSSLLAREHGVNWWRELATADELDEMLGVMDDIYFSTQVAPLLASQGAAEFDEIKIDQDDLLFLQVAVDEGAVNGVFVKSNTIYRKAVGLPECPRELRQRLAVYGLIETARGKGFTVTSKGQRYVKLMRAIVPH